jgi:glycosyltransferase involved in cell wall biosynthesis
VTLEGEPARPSIGLVVPCLNEAQNLPHLFRRLPADHIDEVILVDGGSSDDSVSVAVQLRPSVTIVKQTRTGKGNALACGFAASSSDILITVDADGSADPAEIPRFVAALRGGAHFAKGSRFLPGAGSDDITRFRRWGNGGLTALTNRLFESAFTDLCYGYNAFWRSVVPSFDLPDPDAASSVAGMLHGDGFEIETLIVLRAARAGLRIVEVPSHEACRVHGSSNLRAYGDGRRVLATILGEWRLARRNRRARTPSSGVVRVPAQRPAHHLERSHTLPVQGEP